MCIFGSHLGKQLQKITNSYLIYCCRVGVASFMSLLVQKVGVDIRPFTLMLSKLLFPVVKEEKSGTAKRAFANACGIVLKYAVPSQAQKLIEDTVALLNGDRNAQVSCAVLLKSFSSMASDVLSGYHDAIVPAIFLARFEYSSYSSFFSFLFSFGKGKWSEVILILFIVGILLIFPTIWDRLHESHLFTSSSS